MKKRILSYFCSVLFLFLLWIIAARIINAELILPYPSAVFKTLLELLKTSVFWICFLHTFLRVIISFIISVVFGSFLGWVRSVSPFFKDFLDFPLSIIRTVPVIALILVALFWFKSDWVPVFVAVLMALPVFSTDVYNGLINSSEKLLFMAKVYNFSSLQIYKYIKLPELKPYFYSGCQATFGLCWKVVAAGEVLSLPKYGFGSIMSKAQVHLETAEVMAVTIMLIIFSFSIEKLLKVVLKNER